MEELDSGSEADDDDDEDDLGDDNRLKNPNADPLRAEEGPSSSKGKGLLFEDPDDRNKSGSKGGLLKTSERTRLAKKKQRAAAIVTKMRRGVKRRKRKAINMGSSDEEDDPDEEAQDESELDDHEGDEVKHISLLIPLFYLLTCLNHTFCFLRNLSVTLKLGIVAHI